MKLKIVKSGDDYQLVKMNTTLDGDVEEQIIGQSEDFKAMQRMYLQLTHDAALSEQASLLMKGK